MPKKLLPSSPVDWSESLGISLSLLDPAFSQALQAIQEPSSSQVVLDLIKSDIHNLRSSAKNVQKLRSNVHKTLFHPILWGLLVQPKRPDNFDTLCDALIRCPLLIAPGTTVVSDNAHTEQLLQTPFRIMTLTETVYTHLMVGTLFRLATVMRQAHQDAHQTSSTTQSIDTLLKKTQTECSQIVDSACEALQYLHQKSPSASAISAWHAPFLDRITTFFAIRSIQDSTDNALVGMYNQHIHQLMDKAHQLGLGHTAHYRPIDEHHPRERSIEQALCFSLHIAKTQQLGRFCSELFTHNPNDDHPFLPNLFVKTFTHHFAHQLKQHGITTPLLLTDIPSVLEPLLNDTTTALTDYHTSDQIFAHLQQQGILPAGSNEYLLNQHQALLLSAIFPARQGRGYVYPRNEHWLTFALQSGFDPKYTDAQGNTLLSLLNDKATALSQIGQASHLSPVVVHCQNVCAQMFRKLLEFGTPIDFVRPQKSPQELLANDQMRHIYDQFSEQHILEKATEPSNTHSKRVRL